MEVKNDQRATNGLNTASQSCYMLDELLICFNRVFEDFDPLP